MTEQGHAALEQVIDTIIDCIKDRFRWQITLPDGRTRCGKCGDEWPWKVWTTEELFPGVADWLDRNTKETR